MSKIFVTSDLHLNHDKPFIYEPRGFNSIDEMNGAIVTRWNSIVSDGDIVYNLGDVFLGANMPDSLNLITQLNGKIYYAYGNHDTDKRISALELLPNTTDIQFGYRLKCHKYNFLLTHYPMMTGNFTKDKVFSLHGHTHQNTNFTDAIDAPWYHVGVDSHDCYPIDFEQIYAEIQEYKHNCTSVEK